MNILITSCNHKFFKSCKTLIASIHRHSMKTVKKIYVWDLGLKKVERRFLNLLKLVEIMDYPKNLQKYWKENNIMKPKWFAWKCYILYKARELGDTILYLDSGAMARGDLKEMYDFIKKDEIFMVNTYCYRPNYLWCHKKCIQIMDAQWEHEINGGQICGGIQGYKASGKYAPLYEQAWNYAKCEDVITNSTGWIHCTACGAGGGCGITKTFRGHRHDQSIYSILAARFGVHRHSPERHSCLRYGEWRAEFKENALIYVHRRRFFDEDGLLFKETTNG